MIYVDGPFYGEGENIKERAESLRRQVYEAMCARAALSDCAYFEYNKVDDARLAAALNNLQSAKKVRGKARRAAVVSEAESELFKVCEELAVFEGNDV